MDLDHRPAWLRRASAGALIAAGIAMLVLPGPGVVTLVAGVAMLERDVPAVGRAMAWVRRTWARLSPAG